MTPVDDLKVCANPRCGNYRGPASAVIEPVFCRMRCYDIEETIRCWNKLIEIAIRTQEGPLWRALLRG